MSRRVTPDSSLATLRREAKDWLRRLHADDRDARTRLERALPTAPMAPSLRDVQLALARELGFDGWAALKSAKQIGAGQTREVVASFERMATNLLDAYRTGTPEAMERHWRDTWHRRGWDAMRRYVQLDLGKHAELHEGAGAVDGAHDVDITLDDARRLVARANGFDDWASLVAQSAELESAGGDAAPKGVRLLRSKEERPNVGRDTTRRWDAVFDALEDEEAVGVDAHGQMTDALLERLSHFEHVTTLRLNGSALLTDEGIRHLARLHGLRELDLSGCGAITDHGFAVLRELPGLERINLAMTAITDDGVEALSSCENLERVQLSWTRTGDGALRTLGGKPRLAHVESGMHVTDEGLASLRQFPVFRTWSDGHVELALLSPDAQPNRLTLHGPITDKGLRALAGLDGLCGLIIDDERMHITTSGLDSLGALPHLGMLGVDANDELMPSVASLPALRFLMCQDTQTGDDGWVALSRSRTLERIWGRRCHNLRGRGFAALARLPSLAGLSVSCLNVPDDALALLPEFPSLRELMPMDIPDDGYRHIARCERLDRLILMYCRETTDVATEHIARLSALTKYFASYTRITDRTPELLATMPSLESVELSGCAGVTNAGVAVLRGAPRLREVKLGGMLRVTREVLAAFPPSIHVEVSL